MRTFTTILALLGALIMLASGLVKVLSSSFRQDQSELYELAGSAVPSWFFLAVGVFEVLVAVALVVPRTRVLGGLAFVITMAGALAFNLVLASEGADPDPADFAPVNVVLGALGLLITLLWMWVRRSDKKRASSQPAPSTA